MPTVNPTNLRGISYHFRGYLGLIPQTVVWSRAINQSDFEYPVQTLTFDDAYSGVGANGDVKADMTLIVRDGNTDTVKARLRVAAGAVSGSTLNINEVGNNLVNFADNDRLDVVDEYRIHDKLVSATVNFNKDSRIAYTDQTDNIPPIANGNGAWFGFVDDGQSYATVELSAADSVILDPDNVNGLTYSWDVGDGTISVGTSTDESITVRFPQGFRHVELTVTDADNSASARKEIPVMVYDDANPPISARFDTLRGSQGRGWEATGIELADSSEATIDALPDGAFVCYFEREFYAGTEVSYGGETDGRGHMKFVGYLKRDSVQKNYERETITFDAVGPMTILEQTAALPQILEYDDTPATWQQSRVMTLNAILWYLFYWHTSAATVFDLVSPLPTSNELARIAESNTSSLAEQLRSALASFRYLFTCSRLGRFRLYPDGDYETLRVGDYTSIFTLTEADILDFEVTTEYPPYIYKQTQVEAITYGTTSAYVRPIFARGTDAPTAGAGSDILSNQVTISQGTCNTIAGMHFAKINRLFYNANFLRYEHAPEGARLRMPDGYDVVDPALSGEFINLLFQPGTLTRRDYVNSGGVAYRWWLREVTITYDELDGTKDIQWSLDMETYGLDGVPYSPPSAYDSGVTPLPGGDLTSPDFGDYEPPPASPGALVSGATSIAAALENGVGFGTAGLARTTNFEAASPTWDTVDLTGAAMNDALVDAFSPTYISGSGGVNFWHISNGGKLYYVEDAFGVTPTQTLKYDTSGGNGGYALATERGFQNQIGILRYGTTSQDRTNIWYSTDNSTFNTLQIDHASNGVLQGAPSAHLSARISQQMLLTMSNPPTSPRRYNFGGSATQISLGGLEGIFLFVPFLLSDDDSVFYVTTSTGVTFSIPNARLQKYNNGVLTDITPYDGSTPHVPMARGSKRPMAVADTDPNTLAICGYPDGQGDPELFVSRNGGNSWAKYATSGASYSAYLPYGCAFAGNNANVLFVWGGASGVGGFVAVLNLSGNSVIGDSLKLDGASGIVRNIFGG